MASGTEGQALAETTYSYDSKGRVEKISAGNKDQTPVTFRYDEHGRKTRIVTSTASDYRPNVATGGSPFEAAETPPNLPGGGTSSTIYDEHDRATEIQVRDSDGALVYRALRTYDAEGHISEETQVHDDLMKMFPPEARQQMLDESGLSAEQLGQEFNAQVTRLMKGQNSAYWSPIVTTPQADRSTPVDEFSIRKTKSRRPTTIVGIWNRRSRAALGQTKMNGTLRYCLTPRRGIRINMIGPGTGQKRPAHTVSVQILDSKPQRRPSVP